jgi:hypothetical protein
MCFRQPFSISQGQRVLFPASLLPHEHVILMPETAQPLSGIPQVIETPGCRIAASLCPT